VTAGRPEEGCKPAWLQICINNCIIAACTMCTQDTLHCSHLRDMPCMSYSSYTDLLRLIHSVEQLCVNADIDHASRSC